MKDEAKGGARFTLKRLCYLCLSPSAFLLAGLALVAAGEASCQTYPVRPVRLIVPFAPGGTVDILARVIGARLGETLTALAIAGGVLVLIGIRISHGAERGA